MRASRSVLVPFALGVAMGLLVGGLPLLGARVLVPRSDPFDHGLSYVVWLGGSFVAALALARRWPDRRKALALAVVSGFVGATVVEIVLDLVAGGASPSHTLWPLTIVLTLALGVPPAVAGACLGARLGSVE